MKNLLALAILALGLSAGLIGTINSASALTWQEEAFTPKN